MIVLATTRDYIIAAPISFVIGLFVGFWLSSFYRIVKRNGNGKRGP